MSADAEVGGYVTRGRAAAIERELQARVDQLERDLQARLDEISGRVDQALVLNGELARATVTAQLQTLYRFGVLAGPQSNHSQNERGTDG